jgi:antitoxin (DNA-binding transcriptional repressor) of toxin-antitoxin stability system
MEAAMEEVDLRHAKEHLEELIERARRGEDVRISDPKAGTVRLLPVQGAGPDLTAPRVTDTMPPFVPLKEPRVLGHLKGKMQVPARLMEPMSEEELRDWYGDDA